MISRSTFLSRIEDRASQNARKTARPLKTSTAAARPPNAPAAALDGIGSAAQGELDHASVLAQPEAPQVERIERLKPSQMIPDRFQPRRLLPTVLRQPFYSGQIDCYQAARQWLQMARSDNGMQGAGRPPADDGLLL